MGVFSDYFSDARFIFYEFLKFYKVLNSFSDFTNSFLKIYLPIFKSGSLILANQSKPSDQAYLKTQAVSPAHSFFSFAFLSPSLQLGLFFSLDAAHDAPPRAPPPTADHDMQDRLWSRLSFLFLSVSSNRAAEPNFWNPKPAGSPATSVSGDAKAFWLFPRARLVSHSPSVPYPVVFSFNFQL